MEKQETKEAQELKKLKRRVYNDCMASNKLCIASLCPLWIDIHYSCHKAAREGNL